MDDSFNFQFQPVRPTREILEVSQSQLNCSVVARRTAYTLAAGAAVVSMPMEAESAIYHSGVKDLSIPQRDSEVIELVNLRGCAEFGECDSTTSLILKNYVFLNGNYQGLSMYNTPPGGKLVGFRAGQNNFAYVSALQPGFIVDASTVGTASLGSMAYGSNNPNAQFNSGTDAYFGFSFGKVLYPLPVTTHYGWMRVSINNSAGTFLIRDWAIQSRPGIGIVVGNAGQTGDFDEDGDVDGHDFLAWQRGESARYPLSDDDLEDWQTHYGASALNATQHAVPEPLTLGLLAAGAAGLILMRHSRHS